MKRLMFTIRILLLIAIFGACEKKEDEKLEPLAAEAQFTNVSKFNGSDGTIDITVTGGKLPYTFSWTNSATSEDLQNLKAGEYLVTITDAKGNSISKTVTITQPSASAIELTFTKKDVSGFGKSDGSIDLTVKGALTPFKIEWNNGLTVEDPDNLKAGEYTVTVSDDNNSNANLKVTILEPSPEPIKIAYEIKQKVSYYGASDGFIDITVSGGIKPYVITWSDGKVREDRSSIKAGDYEVTVTDSLGASASQKITLEQPEKLFETIEFPSEDGVTITADLYHLSDDAPVIVLCHQAGYSRGEYRYTATIFKSLGFNCLAIDQRSGDICNGVDNETNKKAKEKGLKTDYWDAEPDIKAAVKYMSDK